jgi:hypothetical protein
MSEEENSVGTCNADKLNLQSYTLEYRVNRLYIRMAEVMECVRYYSTEVPVPTMGVTLPLRVGVNGTKLDQSDESCIIPKLYEGAPGNSLHFPLSYDDEKCPAELCPNPPPGTAPLSQLPVLNICPCRCRGQFRHGAPKVLSAVISTSLFTLTQGASQCSKCVCVLDAISRNSSSHILYVRVQS